MRLPASLDRFSHLVREGLRFLAVGGLGYLVDVGVFNLLLYAGDGLLEDRPITAKVISVVIATIVTYAGNRIWTFSHRARTGVAREYALFFVLNALGLLITAAPLAVTRYVLDLSGPLVDNLAANVVGWGLASLFRFWSYRRWVFKEHPELNQPIEP
jgi:putative flippase GtrA